MKKVMSWLLLLSFIGLLLFVVSKPARAQDKTFMVGVLLEISNFVVCFDQESARVIADNKGKGSPEIDALAEAKKCLYAPPTIVFRGVYTQEVYRNGEWAVWEFKSGSATLYEATDWTPVVKGQVGT